MENTDNEEVDDLSEFGFGIPHCSCGQCNTHLMDEDGVIVVSMEYLKTWFEGVCPKAA